MSRRCCTVQLCWFFGSQRRTPCGWPSSFQDSGPAEESVWSSLRLDAALNGRLLLTCCRIGCVGLERALFFSIDRRTCHVKVYFWKTHVESKKEPPLQDHGQRLIVYVLLLLYTKTPEIVKKQIPPLQDSARSNSKYIGEKLSVLLWYTANPQRQERITRRP